jgi:hypothetical protein
VSVRECPVENTSYGSGDDLECGKQKTIKCGQWEERKKKGKKKRVRRKEGEGGQLTERWVLPCC